MKTLKTISAVLALISLSAAQYPADSLVAFFPFTGNYENATDTDVSIVPGNEPFSITPPDSADRNGNPRSSRVFDDAAGFRGDDALLPLGNSDRTVSTWIKPLSSFVKSSGEPEPNTILSWGNPQPGELFQICLTTSPDDVSTFLLLTTDLVDTITFEGTKSETFVKNGVWAHIAVSVDGDSTHIYFNGDKVASQEMSWNTSPGELCIGWRHGTRMSFWGHIDDIAIYSRALSNQEINLVSRNNTQAFVEQQTKTITPFHTNKIRTPRRSNVTYDILGRKMNPDKRTIPHGVFISKNYRSFKVK